jgi:hypothetical protein
VFDGKILEMSVSRARSRVRRRCLKSLWRFRPEMDRLEDRTVPSVTLGVNYAGINSNNSSCGCEPPDTIAAAGPTNVIELVNLAMQINTKAGALVSTTPLATFFSSLSPASQSDPFVMYDESITNSSGPSGRFIIGVLDFTSTSSPNSLDFAVSNDSDATHGFSAMHKFAVGEGSFFADYPREGFNADAFFVTFNMFTSSGGYSHPQVMAIQMSTIINGGSSTFTSFHHDANSGLFTLAPALMHGAAAGGPEYFVTEALTANQIDVIKETNVLSNTPTDTDNNIGVASYVQPPAAPQPGGGTMTANDSRVLNSAWRNNILVASQTVGTGSPTEAHARWYQFSTSSTPSLTQSGEINPGSGVATFFPSIDIDANNELGMTYMEASSSEFTSMYVTGRTPTDATGTMETAVRAAAGTVAYGGTRAGDFSGTSVDPSTGTSFWSANEYVPSGPLWSTWVANYSVATVQTDHLSVSAPGTSTAGAAFSITVTALNSSNATDPTYRGTIHFTSTDVSPARMGPPACRRITHSRPRMRGSTLLPTA